MLSLNFLDRFSKDPQISSIKKTRSARDKLLRADGRKDTTKLIVSFRNSTKVPKKDTSCNVHRLLSVVNSKSMNLSIRARKRKMLVTCWADTRSVYKAL